jgi:hypothetical protein
MVKPRFTFPQPLNCQSAAKKCQLLLALALAQ